MNKITVYILLCFALMLTSSCATTPQTAPDAAQDSLDNVVSSVDAQLMSFISSAPEGAMQYFAHSDLGDDVTIVAGRAYTSALGAKCREALAARTGLRPKRFAICLDESKGVWRPAPIIFTGGSE